jgi:Cu(I)/Ag(I) efflux system membrane protein CusA/SilA
VQRIRPKTMAVVTTFIALVPILWSTGTGADVMRRIAAPMVGGLFTSFVGELIVFPAIYFVWRAIGLERTPLFETPEETQERTSQEGEAS